MSTLRPRTRRRPRSSSAPRSPVCRRPRRVGPSTTISPSAAISPTTPGSGRPEVSVSPASRDGDRGAGLGEPVGRRDRPAGVAGAGQQRRVGGRAAEHHDAQRRRRLAVEQPAELGRDERGDRDVVACRRARAPRSCRRSRERSRTISPPTWLSGSGHSQRSRRSCPSATAQPSALWRICPSVSTTGRGVPVVPDVWTTSGAESRRGRARACAPARAARPWRRAARRQRPSITSVAPARRGVGSRRSSGTAATPASRQACRATAKSRPGGSAIATRRPQLRRRPRQRAVSARRLTPPRTGS